MSFNEEEKSLLNKLDEGETLPSSNGFSLMKKFGAVSLIAGAAFLLFNQSAPSTQQLENKLNSLSASISIYNEYSLLNDDGTPIEVAGKSNYVSLEGFSLVEPYRVTTLKVFGDFDDDATFMWEFKRPDKLNSNMKSSDDSDTDDEIWGQDVERVFKSAGYTYDISVTIYSGTTVLTLTANSVCMYVRRELRSLNEMDRTEILSAMWVPYSLPIKEGQKLYGSEYMDMDTINGMHNYWAADITCDHLHDGPGFTTQHLGITIRYEAVIQAINPRIVMPYWEYTIEAATIETDYNGDYNAFYDISPVFSDDWFGDFDTMKEPWSGIVTDKHEDRHNPFGLTRAPWNFASDTKVLRYKERCGFNTAKMLLDMETPSTCSAFADVLALGYFEDFQLGLMLAPHGSIHILMGGVGGDCSTGYKAGLSEYFDDSSVAKIAQLSAISVKVLWREGYLDFHSCTTETPDECSQYCTTDDYEAVGYSLFFEPYLYSPWGIEAKDDSNTDYLYALGKTVCTNTLSIGDMYSSSATIDPLFWVMHTTIDRLFQFKRSKTYAFIEDTWTDSTCLGHSSGDDLFFDISNQIGESGMPVTNGDLLTLSDPLSANYGLKYIYDSFDYSHCDLTLYPEFAFDYYPDDDAVIVAYDAPTNPDAASPSPTPEYVAAMAVPAEAAPAPNTEAPEAPAPEMEAPEAPAEAPEAPAEAQPAQA